MRCFISAPGSQCPDLQVPFVTQLSAEVAGGPRRCVSAAIYGQLQGARCVFAVYGSSLAQFAAWHPLHMRK